MHSKNIYKKVFEGDCKSISFDQFTPILGYVIARKLSTSEIYILEHHFVYEETVSNIRYQLGYRGTSQVYAKIKKILKLLREEINFRYCEKEDPLSLFVGKTLVKQAKICDCSIKVAISMYSNPGYVYVNKYDEVIAYTILKRFSYPANLIGMYSLKEDEWTIALYDYVYPNGANFECSKNGETYEYMFIRNVYKVLTNIGKANPILLHAFTLTNYPDDLAKLYELKHRLKTYSFKKLIYDPGCLYTEEYFDHKEPTSIGVEYLYTSLSEKAYAQCVKILKDRGKQSLHSLLYSIVCFEVESEDVPDSIKSELLFMIDDMCKANPSIAAIVKEIKKAIAVFAN